MVASWQFAKPQLNSPTPLLDLLHQDPKILRARLVGLSELDPRPLDLQVQPAPMPLDPEQSRAAQFGRGPLRVLAPAGSGKTRTLTARIAHLTACGIPAERILALAFNSRAAQEMQTRLANLDISGVRTATFHALGFEVLREQSNWSLDGEKYHEMLEETLAARLDVAPRSSQVEALAKHVLQVRTELVRPDSLLDTLDSSLSFAALYADFCSRQQHARVLNFEDMIYLALQSLLGSESLRRKWQTRFEFVLVDEFQDLNLSQMIFMQVLALPHNNLFVVGDDDQLIYSWRGAEVRHTLDFATHYPAAQSVVLKTNYRSAQRIVSHGRRLIEWNSERVAKDFAARAGAPIGKISLRTAPGLQAQADLTAKWLCEEDGYTAERGLQHEWAILVRQNGEARRIAATLKRLSLPFFGIKMMNMILSQYHPDT